VVEAFVRSVRVNEAVPAEVVPPVAERLQLEQRAVELLERHGGMGSGGYSACYSFVLRIGDRGKSLPTPQIA
jgi:hypothetical protein